MVIEHDELLRKLENQIDQLAQRVPSTQDLARFARDISELGFKIELQKEQIQGLRQSLGDAQPDLSPVLQKSNDVERRIEAIDRKTPPLATLIAAAFILIGAVGISAFKIFSLSEPVEKLSSQLNALSKQSQETVDKLNQSAKAVSDAATELDAGRASLEGLSKKLVSLKQTVEDSLSQNQAEIGVSLKGYAQQLDEQIAKLSKFDELVSRTLVKLEAAGQGGAHDGVGKPSPILGSDTQGDAVDNLASMLGDQLPAYMRLLLQSRKELRDGRYKEARAMAQQAKEEDPDTDKSHYDFLIGQTYYKEKQYEKAVASFREALTVDPNCDACLNNIGAALYAMALQASNPDERKRLLLQSAQAQEQSLNITPEENNPSQFANVVTVYNTLGELDKAIAVAERFKGTPSAELELVRANSYALKGEHAQAISALSGAISIDRGVAVLASLDDDFKSLRGNPAFQELLEKTIGHEMMEKVKENWKKK
jgi:tetratricopeptide (TPR) repeat protein